METVASAYQAYFVTRFQSNSNRDLNVNYFVTGSRAACCPISMPLVLWPLAAVLKSVQSLCSVRPRTDVDCIKDAYGKDILLDNSATGFARQITSSASIRRRPIRSS
jgi:hypothetical protein